MSSDHQRPFAERFKKILVVTEDDRVARMLHVPFEKILPAAEISSVNPTAEQLPNLIDVDLMVMGMSQQWPGATDWLAHHAVRRMPPIISIDFSAEIGTAVTMMRLGVLDYIPSDELDEKRLVVSLMLVHSDIPVEEEPLIAGDARDSTGVAAVLNAAQLKEMTGAEPDATAISPYIPGEYTDQETEVMPSVAAEPGDSAATEYTDQETEVMPSVADVPDHAKEMPGLPPESQPTEVLPMPDFTKVKAQAEAAPAADEKATTNAFSNVINKLEPTAAEEPPSEQPTQELSGDALAELQKQHAGQEEVAKDSQVSPPPDENTDRFMLKQAGDAGIDVGAATQIAPHLNATPQKGQFEVNEDFAKPGEAAKGDAPFSGAWLRMPDSVGEQAWPFSAAEMEEGNATLGNYRVLDFLGVGGMASVFKAQRISDDALFAIKLLDPNMADDSVRERFKREFTILDSIHHKHVVKMEEQVEEGEWIYSVMEYLPGGDLKSRIRRRLKRQEAVRYAAQIAAALQAAHKLGVLHRDLKPANVLFRSDGTLALVDFGVAKDTKGGDTALTKEGQMVGTPYYASPEQATGAKVDLRSDLYALGVILFEMLEGRRPFVGDTSLKVLMSHVKDPVPLLSQEWDVLNDVLAQLLAKDPNDRFPDGAAVVHALEEASPGDVPEGLLAKGE